MDFFLEMSYSSPPPNFATMETERSNEEPIISLEETAFESAESLGKELGNNFYSPTTLRAFVPSQRVLEIVENGEKKLRETRATKGLDRWETRANSKSIDILCADGLVVTIARKVLKSPDEPDRIDYFECKIIRPEELWQKQEEPEQEPEDLRTTLEIIKKREEIDEVTST